jgi:hypothetical protein
MAAVAGYAAGHAQARGDEEKHWDEKWRALWESGGRKELTANLRTHLMTVTKSSSDDVFLERWRDLLLELGFRYPQFEWNKGIESVWQIAEGYSLSTARSDDDVWRVFPPYGRPGLSLSENGTWSTSDLLEIPKDKTTVVRLSPGGITPVGPDASGVAWGSGDSILVTSGVRRQMLLIDPERLWVTSYPVSVLADK